MSQLIEQFRKSQGLLSAINAVTDRRAYATLFSTFVISALVTGLFSTATIRLLGQGNFGLSKVIGGLGLLAVWAVLMIGASATGFLLNARVRGREQYSIGRALMLSLATVHRVLGVLLTLGLVAIAALLLVLLALLVCKIPVLGPLLFAVVYPASAVLLGLMFFAGLFVVALHGPAIWEGHAVFRSVCVLGAIFRARLFSVVVQSLLLALLVGLVGMLALACLSLGLSMSSAMSMTVLGQSLAQASSIAGLGSLMMGGGGGASSYLEAGLLGVAVLAGMAITAPMLVAIAGSCIVFANATENLSTTGMEEQLQGAVDLARAKAEQARRQLDETSAQLGANNAPLAASAAPASACTQCDAPLQPSDAFCGNCGKRSD